MPGRIQLALNVDDLGESIAFYSKLFATQPAKVRPGYANFAVAEPPLKLVLLENPGHGGSLNHLGVEVASTDVVEAEQARLAADGLATVEERDTTCCYARQDKFWVKGAPDSERWEVYTVLNDSPTFWGQEGSQRWEAAVADRLLQEPIPRTIGPVQRFKRRLKKIAWWLPLRPAVRFVYAYFLRLGFLDGKPGLYFCGLLAFYDFLAMANRFE